MKNFWNKRKRKKRKKKDIKKKELIDSLESLEPIDKENILENKLSNKFNDVDWIGKLRNQMENHDSKLKSNCSNSDSGNSLDIENTNEINSI